MSDWPVTYTLTVIHDGTEMHYVLASRLREAEEEIRATREMMRVAERDRDDAREENERFVEERGDLLWQLEELKTLREENERLKANVWAKADKEAGYLIAEIKRLQSRLSASDADCVVLRQQVASLETRLSAAEEEQDSLAQEYSLLELRFERAEAVAKAADRYTDSPSEGAMADLIRAIRQYEEGK